MNAYTPSLRDAIFRTDIYAFDRKAFEVLHPNSTLQPTWHLELIAQDLSDILAGKERRLILNAPPRSLKSFLGSVAFPAFVLGHNPSKQIICVSYTQDLANDLSSMRRRLMESDFYGRLFPNVRLIKRTESEIQSDVGGFCYATSVGGTLTGRGGDFVIIDDPLNANEAYSEVARNRTNEWYSQTLLSRLNDKQRGAIIAIMQRLHQYDFTGYLLEQGGVWKHRKFPAIALEDTVISLPGRQHIWKKGEPLQPERDPIKVWEDVKKEVGLLKWNSQYLQEPMPESGNILKSGWLKYCEVIPSRQPGDQIAQSWDTAVKLTEASKFSVCLTFLVRNKNEYYLIDVFRQKIEFPELNKFVIAHAQKYNADAILIEDQMSGSSLIQAVRRAGLQSVVPMRPDADKRTRMYNQTPKLEAGSLILPRSAPWLSDFLEEYLAFPEGRYDDQIDALSQFLSWRTNKEYSLFNFDFGHDDEPSPDSILYFFGRR